MSGMADYDNSLAEVFTGRQQTASSLSLPPSAGCRTADGASVDVEDSFLQKLAQYTMTNATALNRMGNCSLSGVGEPFVNSASGVENFEYNLNWTAVTQPSDEQVSSGSDFQTGNEYDEYEAPSFNERSLVTTIVLLAMFVVALAGNAATLVRMYHMRRRRSTINLLITHLAAADLVVTFFCNVTDAVWAVTIQWYAGNAACKTLKYLQVFGLYLSTYVVVIISIDRCLAILDPISKNRAPRRVRILLVVAWILSALFSLPQAYIFRVERAPFDEQFIQCVTHGAYTAPWQEQVYATFSIVLMYIIPLVTMVTAYLLIFCTIARKSRDFQQAAADNVEMLSHGGAEVRSRLFCKAKVKSLRMTTVIVAAFIICWTPYQVMFIIHTFAETGIVDRYVMWIFFFGMANSMVNPLIYGAFHCSSSTTSGRSRCCCCSSATRSTNSYSCWIRICCCCCCYCRQRRSDVNKPRRVVCKTNCDQPPRRLRTPTATDSSTSRHGAAGAVPAVPAVAGTAAAGGKWRPVSGRLMAQPAAGSPSARVGQCLMTSGRRLIRQGGAGGTGAVVDSAPGYHGALPDGLPAATAGPSGAVAGGGGGVCYHHHCHHHGSGNSGRHSNSHDVDDIRMAVTSTAVVDVVDCTGSVHFTTTPPIAAASRAGPSTMTSSSSSAPGSQRRHQNVDAGFPPSYQQMFRAPQGSDFVGGDTNLFPGHASGNDTSPSGHRNQHQEQ